MRTGLIATVAFGAALWAGQALADEASDCTTGIETIKAAIAKNPAADTLEKLKKYLADAERELGEKQYDECLEAVQDAQEIAGG
ncbi:MAG: hypothetical protein U1E46_08270 [Hyphomicrobiales bacterium]